MNQNQMLCIMYSLRMFLSYNPMNDAITYNAKMTEIIGASFRLLFSELICFLN